VLYALAAEAMGHNVTEARLAYATLRSNYRLDPVQLDSRARMQAETVLRTIDDWIDKGFLPAAPRIEGCKRCEYVPVCGPYEELRVKQKSQPELRDLVRIREMP
jgi:CRISPR/Cas system-associated exonuclease Cas4 (RecB family)